MKECYFIYLNACGILVSVYIIIAKIVITKDDCPLRLNDVAVNYRDVIDDVAIFAAVFGGCVVYPLGIAGAKTRKKLLLLVYTGGMGVLIVTHLTLLIVSSINLANFGFVKMSYTECLEKKLDNFNESNPDSFVAFEFEEYKCCSPDGNIVDFWNRTNWHKDPNRNQHVHVEVPIQCCKNPDSDSCRIKGSGNDDRLTVGCWEAKRDKEGAKTKALTTINTIWYGIFIFIDWFLAICCAFQTLLDECMGGLQRGQRGRRHFLRGSQHSLQLH